MLKIVLFVVLLLTLVSCLSPTPYQSRTQAREGYSNLKLSDTRYRVVFQGNEETGRERAFDFARLHAAVIAISNGYHYFSVVKNEATVTYRNATGSRNLSPLRYTKDDGTLVVVEKYQTEFNGSKNKNRHAIAMPRVIAIIELHSDNYEQNDTIFNADEIKATITKKYQINL